MRPLDAGAPVDRPTIVLALAGALGVASLLRQRAEAVQVRTGDLPRLGPDGQPDELPDDPVHAAIAEWRPAPAATPLGRGLVTLWSAPATLAGLLASLLGGVRPVHDDVRHCFVSRGVRGLPGAYMRAQGAGAATLGRVVLSQGEAPSPGLLDHEAVHVRQNERLGPLFALVYPLAQARWGYRANPFEAAARRGAAREDR